MPIILDTNTNSTLAQPSSENLLTLIIVTGGLLFICLVLLIIVVLRSKARRKKANMVAPPIPQVNTETPKTYIKEPEKTVVKEVIAEKKPEPKKEVVEVVIKKEEIKPVVEVKKEEVKPIVETPPPIIKKEEPIIKTPEPVKHETPKPDEVIIKIEEKKPELKPATSSIDEKKKEFKKALEETHSKEDNLKILQERLAELSKEKKTVVSFVEPETLSTSKPEKEEHKEEEKKKPVVEEKLVDLTAFIKEKLQAKTDEPTQEIVKQEIVPAIEKQEPIAKIEEIENKVEEKVKPVEHEKLVDLTALINEKLQTKTEEIKQPELTLPEKEETKQSPTVLAEDKKEEDSHQILSPFFDKIKSNNEQVMDDQPETVISKIDEELKLIAEKETANTTVTVEEPIQTEQVKLKETLVTQKDETPKTFTEWLSTLKK